MLSAYLSFKSIVFFMSTSLSDFNKEYVFI